jgi:N-carbamoylputrescine amidase
MVKVSAVQMSMADDVAHNVATAERLVRQAAADGAKIILIPELFEGHYFCKDQRPEYLERARSVEGHPTVSHFQCVARELGVVLPISIYELDVQSGKRYNSVVMIDADGAIGGVYRKSHIFFSEKYYFSPGDTGFRVWDTRYGRVGVAICWDQWFPECARAMALQGADVILYPTAIGSEPPDPEYDSSGHWTRVMQGHAAANIVPVVAANRTGFEKGIVNDVTFYGCSFISDHTGALIAQAGRVEEAVLTAEFDFGRIRRVRSSWGLFRDRRPELYSSILTLDGQVA